MAPVSPFTTFSMMIVASFLFVTQPFPMRVNAQQSNTAMPTRSQLSAMLRPFIQHLRTPCAADAHIPPACMAELQQIPDEVADLMTSLVDMNATSGDATYFNVAPLCSACPADVFANAYARFSERFDPSAVDPQCGGALPGDSHFIISTFEIMFSSMCSTDQAGSHCWNEDQLPAAMRRAGMRDYVNPDMASQMTATGGNLMGMIRQLDLQTICGGLASGGCCVGNALELNKALMEVNCMGDAARMADMLGMMCAITAPIPRKCSNFKLPDYTPPTICPSMSELISNINTLTPMSATRYNSNCKVPAGTCPRNACETYFCTPESWA